MSTPTANYVPPQNPGQLVLAWLRRAREAQLAHYEMANNLARRAKWLGVPVILITAVVGTSVFVSIVDQVVPVQAKLAIGLLSLAATILSSLQTFFKFSERAESHRVYAARFGAIRRELEALYARTAVAQEVGNIDALKDKLDQLAEGAPDVPPKAFRALQKRLLRQGSA